MQARQPLKPSLSLESHLAMQQRVQPSSRQSWGGAGVTLLVAALGLALPTSAVSARKVTPEAAPKAWIAYAEEVNGKMAAWLRADEKPSGRVRTYLDGLRAAGDQPGAPVTVRLWINAKGIVTRVAFAPLADTHANADLRELLVGRAIGSRPPRGMLLPLRLSVQLEPAPKNTIE